MGRTNAVPVVPRPPKRQMNEEPRSKAEPEEDEELKKKKQFMKNNKSSIDLTKFGGHTFDVENSLQMKQFKPASLNSKVAEYEYLRCIKRIDGEIVVKEAGAALAFTIYPNDPRLFTKVWDITTIICIFWTAVMVPLTLGFANFTFLDNDIWMRVLNGIIDVIFIMDVVFNFRKAYYHTTLLEKFVVADTYLMSKNYLSGWFAMDLLGIGIPFVKSEEFGVMRLFKLLRVVKLYRQITRFTTDMSTSAKAAIQIICILIFLVLLGHWMGCLFWFLGMQGLTACIENPPEIITSEKLQCGWIVNYWSGGDYEVLVLAGGKHYLSSLYFAIVTILTTGYGDITPVSQGEMIFTIVCLVMSVVFYSGIIGTVTSLITSVLGTNDRDQKVMETTNDLIRLYNLPPDMAMRIHRHIEYSCSLKRGLDENIVLNELPRDLLADVNMFMHHSIISKMYFFQEASEGMIRAIVSKLKPVHFMEGEMIFRCNDPSHELFLIRKGSVQILSASGEVLNTLGEGKFFGEIGLFRGGQLSNGYREGRDLRHNSVDDDSAGTPRSDKKHSHHHKHHKSSSHHKPISTDGISSTRSASARAYRLCHLYVLDRNDYEKVVKFYPSFRDVITKKATNRLRRDTVRKVIKTKGIGRAGKDSNTYNADNNLEKDKSSGQPVGEGRGTTWANTGEEYCEVERADVEATPEPRTRGDGDEGDPHLIPHLIRDSLLPDTEQEESPPTSNARLTNTPANKQPEYQRLPTLPNQTDESPINPPLDHPAGRSNSTLANAPNLDPRVIPTLQHTDAKIVQSHIRQSISPTGSTTPLPPPPAPPIPPPPTASDTAWSEHTTASSLSSCSSASSSSTASFRHDTPVDEALRLLFPYKAHRWSKWAKVMNTEDLDTVGDVRSLPPPAYAALKARLSAVLITGFEMLRQPSDCPASP